MSVLLCLGMFLSGAAALLFETLWFRQAGLMLGNSVWSTSLVTASFMGGLALGNGAVARWGPELRRPVALYALLEATIGATGLGVVLLFPALTKVLLPLFRLALDRPELLNGMRLLAALLVLLVPATAMGATLPVLVRALSARDPNFGAVLGRLYGWNTLGAVAGALAGELVLIERLGVTGSAIAAAALNGTAALIATALARRGDSTSAVVGEGPRAPLTSRGIRLLLAAFLCGGVLLGLEVLWFRFLLLFVLASSLTFAIMLAVVLAGIAGGGLAAAFWMRRRDDVAAFVPLLAFAAGIATVVTYAGFVQSLPQAGNSYYTTDRAIALRAIRLMLPVSFLSGLLFSLLGKCLQAETGGDARAAGLLTLANTVGAMLGGLLAGFLLLPVLGIERSLCVFAVAYGGVALAAAPGRTAASHPRQTALTALAAALFAAVTVLFPFGLMQRRYLPLAAARWMEDGTRVVAAREGLTETIQYLRKDLWGEPVFHRLVTNGFSMSSSHFSSARYMQLFVYLPIALRPEARHALLISYGVGCTARALTDTRSLESIDVVDISREILEMGRLVFPEPTRQPLDDPRVRVHVEDGRFFLMTTDRRYDVITGEPPPPKNAGIVNLYSREYFALMRERLAEGGVATYWLPVYQLDLGDTKAVIGAFCDVFDDCSLWSGFGTEWMLVGTRHAVGPVPEDAFRRQWNDPVVGPAMAEVGFEAAEQLGTTFLADAAELREFTRGVAPLEDDHPYRLSRRLAGLLDPSYLTFMDWERARSAFERSALVRRLWPPALRVSTLQAFEEERLLDRYFLLRWDLPSGGLPELTEFLTHTSLKTPVLWLLRSSVREQRIAADAERRGVREPLLGEFQGIQSMAERDYARAAERFASVQADAAEPARLAQLRVLALVLQGRRTEAQRVMAQAPPVASETERDAWSWLKQAFSLAGPDARSGAIATPD